MPRVIRTPPSGSMPFELITLSDEDHGASVTVVPARGAIITSYKRGERELLYLDPATLVDISKSVRGGIPVLFPSPGKLAGDEYARNGRTFTMKQHGFARELPWTVSGWTNDPSVTLTLESSAATREKFPFDFTVAFRISLKGGGLSIDQRVENRSREPMPFAMGFHPYFAVTDKAAVRVPTSATRAFDNTTKRIAPFGGFDFTQGEVDLHLEDHGSASIALEPGDGTRIEMHASDEFWRWVIWTLPGKDFVCVEPWTAAGNALNTGERLLTVEPGAARELLLEIR